LIIIIMFGEEYKFVIFSNKLIFYDEKLLAPRATPKLEDHILSAVRDCLFNIFAANHHTWRPSPPSAIWGRAMPWWQGAQLIWCFEFMVSIDSDRVLLKTVMNIRVP
jgi:hypothetical protein